MIATPGGTTPDPVAAVLARLYGGVAPGGAKVERAGPVPLTMPELDAVKDEAEFLWRGIVAVGAVTVLGGEPKAGKSYLVAGLLAALERGHHFLGLPTSKTTALVLSEEPISTLRAKRDRFRWEGVRVHPRAHAFPRRPWVTVVEDAIQTCDSIGARLLVVDTWAHWAGMGPDSENDAGATTAALAPLLEASTRGLAVLIVHHVRKGQGEGVTALRGSSALPGGVDVIAVFRKAKGGKDRRHLTCEGRWEASAVDLVCEMTEDSFKAIGDPDKAAEDDVARRIVAWVTENPWQPTRTILEATQTNRNVGLAVLANATAAGVLVVDGAGSPKSPRRYAAGGTPTPATDDSDEG